jgi:U3 small nucleolar RNA-associated protein MPP10
MSSDLLDILKNRPQDLLIPNEKLQAQALEAIKTTFDPIAGKYSIFEEIHVEGLDAEQVWAQAEMVIDGVVEKVMSEEIPELREAGVLKRTASAALSDNDEDESDSDNSEGFESALENEEMAEAQAAEENESEDEQEEVGIEAGSDSDIDMNDFDGKDDYEETDLEENEENQDEEEDEDGDNEAEAGTSEDKNAFGLNTGLFNLDEFKSQVLALEDDNLEDDDENIDYFADPDAQDSDVDEKDDDVKFEDFFAPPKKTKSKKPASKKSQKAFDGLNLEPENEEYEEVMDSVRKDLFADEEEDDSDADGKENLSTFEKQQREIMKQISQLESENVGEKSWQVKGEAKAKDRPENSLLEADLDFERSAKPVPVITKESTETLEDMIRRRIKTYDFDDLPRRVPDSLPEFKPSKLAEVQETKSTKGLGELYEEDYLRKENPDAVVTAEAEKQSEAHKEIRSLWSDLSRKLDTLSSWTYTPKAPKPSISIVANTAAIAMEEAQPTAMATESALAPQEVYNPTAQDKREVVGHSGLPVAKSEMSREERKRERRKHKAKKAKILQERDEQQKVRAQKQGSKADIMQTLKKGNVTIIDKKGAKRDIAGNLKKNKAALGASQLKL